LYTQKAATQAHLHLGRTAIVDRRVAFSVWDVVSVNLVAIFYQGHLVLAGPNGASVLYLRDALSIGPLLDL
jgi:hypothetical protein